MTDRPRADVEEMVRRLKSQGAFVQCAKKCEADLCEDFDFTDHEVSEISHALWDAATALEQEHARAEKAGAERDEFAERARLARMGEVSAAARASQTEARAEQLERQLAETQGDLFLARDSLSCTKEHLRQREAALRHHHFGVPRAQETPPLSHENRVEVRAGLPGPGLMFRVGDAAYSCNCIGMPYSGIIADAINEAIGVYKQ